MSPRRFLFALVDAGGNVPPELGVARCLVQHGHAVTVLGEDSVASEVRATGAVFIRWIRAPNRPDRRPENDPSRDWECHYPWQLIDRLARTQFVGPAPDYARDVLDAIRDAPPDRVICSMFCLGGMVAAEAAGIRFDVLLPNIYLLPAPGLPPFGLGLEPASGILGRWRDRALNGLIERLWDRKGLAGLNALRSQHGLPPLLHFLDQLHQARRQLILTSPDFDFPAALPPSARYVGPWLEDPVWAESARWIPPPGSEPLVLVAMSSTFQDQVRCLQCVCDALASMPVRAIVTTGPAVEITSIRPAKNVFVVQSAPHRQILEHAALVVTHGGHGTVMKALAAGVPMVLLPHGRDQADTAKRVTLRGAGVQTRRSAPVRTIAGAIRQVLEDGSYRAAAQRLGQAVRRAAQGDQLMRELEESSPERIPA
jgi:UDP:flavonoid glycosyltransferase YjiC (YdhE family)